MSEVRAHYPNYLLLLDLKSGGVAATYIEQANEGVFKLQAGPVVHPLSKQSTQFFKTKGEGQKALRKR